MTDNNEHIDPEILLSIAAERALQDAVLKELERIPDTSVAVEYYLRLSERDRAALGVQLIFMWRRLLDQKALLLLHMDRQEVGSPEWSVLMTAVGMMEQG